MKGFELKARWVPVETWFVEAAIGHLDGKITDADPAATANDGPSDGDRCPMCRNGRGVRPSSRNLV